MSSEIEHKYLLSGCPDLVLQNPPALIKQGWVSRLRLREKIGSDNRVQFLGCLKFGQGLARVEFERPIPPLLFRLLWPLTRGHRVHKLRYAISVTTPHGVRVWEIDVFLDRKLFLAEIEVPDPFEPVAVPPWLADKVVREVTEDPRFTNFALRK